MTHVHDDEFGDIIIRRTSSRASMKVTVAPNGQLRISAPRLVPLFGIKRMIATSRRELRRLLENRPNRELYDGLPIGKSHRLRIRVAGDVMRLKKSGQELWLSVPSDQALQTREVTDEVRKASIAALRKEAKHYLPKRVGYLAEQYGFRFNQLRFSHAGTRWGSCSTTGTISLNIALMQVPFELIDYVIIHELAHTKEMNHSLAFWSLVETACPDYKTSRAEMKKYSPAV